MISFLATVGVIGSIVWTISTLWDNAMEDGLISIIGTLIGIWIFFSFISWLLGWQKLKICYTNIVSLINPWEEICKTL